MSGAPEELFRAPLAAELNQAKRLLAVKDFGPGRSVSLWGPGRDDRLVRLTASGATMALTLRDSHPWGRLPGLPIDQLNAASRPLVSQIRRLGAKVAGIEVGENRGSVQVVARWGDFDFPPVMSVGIQLVAHALASGRVPGMIPPPPSLAEVFSRGRRRRAG